MHKVPESVTKEQYLLRSTFFYNKLKTKGYFELFIQLQRFLAIEGNNLNWDNRSGWSISEDAWNILAANGISPGLIFVHPRIITLNPSFLRYYRSVTMIPQKGLKTMSQVSNVEEIENGVIGIERIKSATIDKLVKTINEIASMIITLSSGINENELQGMMFATAGTNIDGSWRNQIGAEGERVIRSIILKELSGHGEVSSITEKNNAIKSIAECNVDEYVADIDKVKYVNLTNGYSVYFASEPDVTMYDNEGKVVGVIEIKSGLDPAGALERLGAMFRSFENTLSEYPNAVTILVASCITEEVESRLNASMVVRQTHIMTRITSNDSEKRKFVNRLRVIMKLANRSI